MTEQGVRRVASSLTRLAEVVVRAGVILTPCMALLGAFLLCAGIDECWILLDIRGLVEHGRYGGVSLMHSSQSVSTSGPFTILVGILEILGGGRLEVVRLVSPVALSVLMFLTWQLARKVAGAESRDCWVACAALLGARGILTLGSLAYGEVLATLLVFGGAVLWIALPAGTWRRRLWTGAVLGLAAGARLNCILALPALAAVIVGAAERRREAKDVGLAAGFGGLVFMAQLQGLSLVLFDPPAPAEVLPAFGLGGFGGVSLAYWIPFRLRHFVIGQDHLGVILMTVVTVGWFAARRRCVQSGAGDFLLAFAWLAYLAWLVRSPTPHLRYLWPALACFAGVGGLSLAAFVAQAKPERLVAIRWRGLAIATACVGVGYTEGARAFLHGEADVMSWEWQRYTPSSLQVGPFRYRSHQRAMVRHLSKLPAADGIATFEIDTALQYLTRRPIAEIRSYYLAKYGPYARRQPGSAQGHRPRWLVSTPLINRFPAAQMTPELEDWIRTNCRLSARHGPYAVYEIIGPLPPDPEIFQLKARSLPLVN